MRLVKTDHEEEWLSALLLQVSDRLLAEVSPRHIGIHRAKWPAGAVKPNAGRISEWFPAGLDFNPSRQGSLSFCRQPLLVLFGIESQIESMFEIAVEVHFANSCGVVAVGLEDLCQSDLIFRQSALELRDADGARITPGKKGLARSGADRRATKCAIKAHSLGCQLVQVWCSHLLIAIGAYDVRNLVIGNNPKNIGPGRLLPVDRIRYARQPQENGEQNRAHNSTRSHRGNEADSWRARATVRLFRLAGSAATLKLSR